MFRLVLKDKGQTRFSIDKPEEFLSAKAIERRRKQQILVNETDLPISDSYIKEIEKTGADVCGENGEYHTVVYDGPLFKTPLNLNFSKEIKDIEGKWAKIEVLI